MLHHYKDSKRLLPTTGFEDLYFARRVSFPPNPWARSAISRLERRPHAYWNAAGMRIEIDGKAWDAYTESETRFPPHVKTYTFKVIVEPDEDRWHAYCPAL